jgi:hypothetical protein
MQGTRCQMAAVSSQCSSVVSGGACIKRPVAGGDALLCMHACVTSCQQQPLLNHKSCYQNPGLCGIQTACCVSLRNACVSDSRCRARAYSRPCHTPRVTQ